MKLPIRVIRAERRFYVVVGPWKEKTLEAGFNLNFTSDKEFDAYWHFRSKGDHAGLRSFLELWGRLFEFNITDRRHWNYKADRFYLPGEEKSDYN